MSSRILRSMLAVALLAVAACGSGTSGGAGSGTGTFAIQLVDAPSPDVKGIIVTIDTVTAHSEEAGWVTIAHGPTTVDLLTLQDVTMKLGEVALPAGTVTEVRLQLVEAGPQYVILADGSHAQPGSAPMNTKAAPIRNGVPSESPAAGAPAPANFLSVTLSIRRSP